MRHFILINFLLLTHFSIYAESPVWRIENNGEILYLAGTIHLLRKSDYPLPSGFETAYKNSSIIVFETDLEALKSPALSEKLLAAIKLPQEQHLFQVLSPHTQHLLKQYSLKNNIQLSKLVRFKPSFVALTLALIELKKMGVSEKGVDEHYNLKALHDKKTILGLETPEQQIHILSQMGQGYEDEFIIQTLNDIKEMNTQFGDMLFSWKHGDLKQIETFFITPTKEHFPIMHQQLLVDRNLAWLPQLQHFLSTPKVEMVMVGSAHLAGNEGLLKILKTKGYKITQLH